ncbi:uncharacterized protein EDB91DRAFT_1238453 [Suillus paluster]|uniref:uncharacterized protein n=1 Tax=Suillus paluster TaxID=48578 RepID=UPI001B85E5E5|nr:uncharacterized protein EDB91DRAFT_1238453 [Suillus paluster]KAG1734269.1 hypothetical protein EDB91DRAFT_1238453 [Suillus paluster]
MTKPEVAHFGDSHFHHVIYRLGPYIANYEEQVLLACIVRGWCPRIAAVASFSGLQHFPEGRGFKQWTGDDSKALMKVYLPAIEGHIPSKIVQAFHALLEFCYYVCRNVISETTLAEIQDALARFHQHRKAFQDAESKHIKAVKEPWQRSSRFNALGQMLRTNQWLDKLAAMCADFTSRRMMNGTVLTVSALAIELEIPQFSALLCQFLFEQLHPDDPWDLSDIPEFQFPSYEGRVSIFNSASSRFYAPSDISGISGMCTEYIWTTFPCAVICWFNTVGNSTDEDTGLWVVHPVFAPNHSPNFSIIHVDSIYRAAHLIPVCGTCFVSCDLKFHHSYDSFQF